MGGSVRKVFGFALLLGGFFFPGAIAAFATSLGVGATLAGGLGSLFVVAGGALLVKAYAGEFEASGSVSGGARNTIRGNVVASRWILGKARTAGVLVRYSEAGGPRKNRDGSDVKVGGDAIAFIVLSEGSCDDVERIWVDGEEVSYAINRYNHNYFDGIGKWGNEGDKNQARRFYGVRVFSANGYGGIYNHQDYFNIFGLPGPNDSFAYDDYTRETHSFKGVSMMICRYSQSNYGQDYENRFYTSNPVSRTEFLVRGIKITWPGQPYPTWTENAAAIRYWYMTERLGIPKEAFDEASVRAAIDLCGETITSVLPPEYVGFTTDTIRYAINGVISSTDSPAVVIREMDFAWQGFAVEVDGIWYFRPGVDRPITRTLNIDSMIVPSKANPTPSLSDRVNALSMTLPQSEDHDFTEYSVPTFHDTDAQNRDGETFHTDLGPASFVNNPISGGRIMATFLKRARASATYVYTLRPLQGFEWMTVIPGDRIYVNEPDRGLVNAPMRIVSSVLRPDMAIEMTVQEAPDGIFTDEIFLPSLKPRQIDFEHFDASPETPGTFTVAEEERPDGSHRLFVSWQRANALFTEIQWQRVNEIEEGNYRLVWGQGAKLLWGQDAVLTWPNKQLIGNPLSQPAVIGSTTLGDLVPGATYEVRARHVAQDGTISAWTDPFRITVSS